MKRSYQWIFIILALLLIIGVYFYIQSALNAQKNKVRQARPAAAEEALDVSVLTVAPGKHAATIKAFGLANARYQLTLTSQVSGKVIDLASNFEVGRQVKKGDVLATLYNTEIDSDVASAKNTLASAELALKEEIRQGEQAKAEWEAAGLNTAPDSDLVLRAPQLAAAKAEYNAAKVALADALDDLQNTKITAPFDALIVSRDIAPGSYLSSSSEIATLYSTDRAEIQIDLASSDWKKLPDAKTLLEVQWPAQIKSIDNNGEWQGHVLNANFNIDESTRMRSLIVALDKPLEQTPQLLPGTFVEVNLEGKPLDNLWQLPNSALSQKSEIWYIDGDSRLAAFETTPVFVDSEYVYIQVPESMRDKSYQVLTQPYNSYLKGSLANPEEIESNATGNKAL